MSSSKIRVGIIGAGGWAKYGHIPALRTLDDFEVVAVSSRSKRTAERLAAAFEIRHEFDDHNDLIADPDVDLVVILALAGTRTAHQSSHRRRKGRLQRVAAYDQHRRV
jgi:predicted dehydrogenase